MNPLDELSDQYFHIYSHGVKAYDLRLAFEEKSLQKMPVNLKVHVAA